MRENKLLLLFASLGVLLLLVIAAVQENYLKEWRRIQGAARSEEGPIKELLRQVVNPGLRSSDRCTSCHVSMGPGEQSVTGATILTPHKPVVHDPAEYGCTVCHGGQGLATEKSDAHGEVSFWPEPMLPVQQSFAGCGTCHAPLGIPNRTTYDRARAAFERLDCRACHRVDGRGGAIRPGGGGMEGPDLSRAGVTGYDRGWYEKHLKKAAQEVSGTWKTSFAPIGEADLDLLSGYLSTLVAAPKLVQAKSVFHSTGCLGCHKVSGIGGDDGPDLSRAGEKDPGQLSFTGVPGKASLPNWQAEHIRSPASVVAGSLMPSLGLSETDVENLTFYILSLRRRDLPGSYMPKDRLRSTRLGEREFASDGATIFGAFCAGCHGPEGRGLRSPGSASFPSIANPDFMELVSDDFLRQTISLGRPGRRMPAWAQKEGGLRPEEIQNVTTYLRNLGGVQPKPDPRPARWVTADASSGRRLFAAACSGCHGREGVGGEAPALNNPVFLDGATDSFLAETIARGRRGTVMEGFLQPTTVRQALARSEIESIVAYLRTWQKNAKKEKKQ